MDNDADPSTPARNSYDHQCERWMERIAGFESFADVTSVCQDICTFSGRNTNDPVCVYGESMFQYWSNGSSDHARDITLQLFFLLENPRLSHWQHKIISKAYYNVCRLNLLHKSFVHPIRGIRNSDDNEEQSLMLHGMLHSTFVRQIRTDPSLSLLPERNLALFLSPTAGYDRCFNTVSENVLTIEKFHDFRNVHNRKAYRRAWITVLMNLESPYHGARHNMLALLKYLTHDEQFIEQIILPVVAGWSWMNRNKYHVLAILLAQHRSSSIMRKLELDGELLGEALKLSLKYKHLTSGGQTLIRILKQDQALPNYVYTLAKDLIENEPPVLVRKMRNYWFSSFSPTDYRKVYRLLTYDQITLEVDSLSFREYSLPHYLTDEKYEKLFLVMHIFRREFQEHPLLDHLLTLLCKLAEDEPLVSNNAREALFETLQHHIICSRGIDRGQLLKKMIEYVIDVFTFRRSPSLYKTAVCVCQRIFTHITQQESVLIDRAEQLLIVKFMTIRMYNRFLRPPDDERQPEYLPTVAALRLFSTIIAQVFEFTADSPYMLVPRSPDSTGWIENVVCHETPFIDRNQLTNALYSMAYGLMHLCDCGSDDIRLMVLKMFHNKAHVFHYEPFLYTILAANMTKYVDQVPNSLTILYNDLIRLLTDAFKLHKADCYYTTVEDTPDSQLHVLVGRCTEVSFGFSQRRIGLQHISEFRQLLAIVSEVVRWTLDTLNAGAGCETVPEAGTSFEIMDRSMQLLLENSPKWDLDSTRRTIAETKQILQKALWKTLRASVIFFEEYALWTLERYAQQDVSETLATLTLCFDAFLDIINRCCHRGAIEVTANGYGRVIKRIMQLKQEHLGSSASLISSNVTQIERHLRNCFDEILRTIRMTTERVYDDSRTRGRGLVHLVHAFIGNDVDGRVYGSFFRTYLEKHVRLGTCVAREDTTVSTLYQLEMIARDTTLNETMLPYINELMILALKSFRSNDWPVRNAALKLYASCITKLVGQKQFYYDPECDWIPVYASFDEILYKNRPTMQYILQELQQVMRNESKLTSATFSSDRAITPFLILVLEFISKLEYRAYHPDEQSPDVEAYRSIMWTLLRHEHDQVRTLAGHCFAQLHDFCTEIPAMLKHLVKLLFTTHDNFNLRHGLCHAVDACVRRWVTLERYHQSDHRTPEEDAPDDVPVGKVAILRHVRRLLSKYYILDRSHHPDAPYRYRCQLLRLLMYAGFQQRDDIVIQLIFNRHAPDVHGLEVFLAQTNVLFNCGREEYVTQQREQRAQYEKVLLFEDGTEY